MCCVRGVDLGRGLQGCCGLQLVRSLPWKDPRILCLLGCSALLHIVQGNPLWERLMLLRCSRSGDASWSDAVAHVRNEPSPGTVPPVGTGSFAFHGAPSCQIHVRGVCSGGIRERRWQLYFEPPKRYSEISKSSKRPDP